MHIEHVSSISEELLQSFQHLIPQLTTNHPVPACSEIETLLASPGTCLLVAREEKNAPIIGMAALVIYHVPTGIRARLEDVVVDQSRRGLGIGAALTIKALQLARQAGADGVALTSNPRRSSANHLYKKLGFKPWHTNLYFYKFI